MHLDALRAQAIDHRAARPNRQRETSRIRVPDLRSRRAAQLRVQHDTIGLTQGRAGFEALAHAQGRVVGQHRDAAGQHRTGAGTQAVDVGARGFTRDPL